MLNQSLKWQARRESNPQPAVLETAALPIELLAYRLIYSNTDLWLTTPGANGTATFTNREAQAVFHSDRCNQLYNHLHVIARHHHLGAFRQLARTRYVRRTEVKLRTIALEERRVTTALVLGQNVNLCLELGVRRDRSRLRQYLATLNVFTLRATQQYTNVVASLTRSSSLRNISTPVQVVFSCP